MAMNISLELINGINVKLTRKSRGEAWIAEWRTMREGRPVTVTTAMGMTNKTEFIRELKRDVRAEL